MSIVKVSAKRMFAGPGNFACIAEAEVVTADDELVYVSVQEYDGAEYAVSKQSVYAFLAGDSGEPAEDMLEEYTSLKEAKTSGYGKVFEDLRKVIRMLG